MVKTKWLPGVSLRPTTQNSEIELKIRAITNLLKTNGKVRVLILFRGREIAHTGPGVKLLWEILGRLKDVSTVEKGPAMEGQRMVAVLKSTKKPDPGPPLEASGVPARPKSPLPGKAESVKISLVEDGG